MCDLQDYRLCSPLVLLLDIHDEIEAANEQFMKAFNCQDAEAVSDLYTDDCTMMPTGTDVVQGRESE